MQIIMAKKMTRREAIKLGIAGTVGALALGGGLIGGTD